MKRMLFFLLVVLFAVPVMSQTADETAPPAESEAPPMGPPPEIQELSGLIGTWDVAMKFRWAPTDTIWEESKGTCVFSYAADGAVLMMVFESEMQGTPFVGLSLQCFDRETNKWQSVWTDNMGARISFYTGDKAADKIVMTGEELYQGVKSIGRLTTYNLTETSFDWLMETSYDGGKTYAVMGSARYTKQ
ncbi:MAG: DUF1579 family protein [Candidatus Zixiibacteriota bacterium]